MVNLEILYRKVWGERSLTLGELICFAIGLILLIKPLLGKWSKWIALLVIFFGMILF
jgi:hypothetical protein